MVVFPCCEVGRAILNSRQGPPEIAKFADYFMEGAEMLHLTLRSRHPLDRRQIQAEFTGQEEVPQRGSIVTFRDKEYTRITGCVESIHYDYTDPEQICVLVEVQATSSTI